MAEIIERARTAGHFPPQAFNPFSKQSRKAGKAKSKEKYTLEEIKALFAALPKRDIAPSKYGCESALPWFPLIAAYSGMRLNEIAQLRVSDIRTEGTNGSTVTFFDIHGDVKTDSSERKTPIHSQIIRAGLLDYKAALPDQSGYLFPNLRARKSKDGKRGDCVSDLMRDLMEERGIAREGLGFHSFRHTVVANLQHQDVKTRDIAYVVGHSQSDDLYAWILIAIDAASIALFWLIAWIVVCVGRWIAAAFRPQA